MDTEINWSLSGIESRAPADTSKKTETSEKLNPLFVLSMAIVEARGGQNANAATIVVIIRDILNSRKH